MHTTKYDDARGIPMAMLFGFSAPVTPPIVEQPKVHTNIPPAPVSLHAKVCNDTIRRGHELLASIGPCESKEISKATGWCKSHTGYVLRALLELGLADRSPLPNNRLLWRAVV